MVITRNTMNPIKILLKLLGIVDIIETTCLMEKCTTIKLLHRCEICEEVLVKNIEEKEGSIKILKKS